MNVIVGYLSKEKKTHKYTEITVDLDEVFENDKFGKKLWFSFNSEFFGYKELIVFKYNLQEELIKLNYIKHGDNIVTIRLV